MKAFSATKKQKDAITAAMETLFDICKSADVPLVIAACIEIEKEMTAEGFKVTVSAGRTVHLNGMDRVPDEFSIMAAFSEGLEDGLAAVERYKGMNAAYGALMMEDNPEAACLHYMEHRDTEAARRIGGSLPPL